MVHINMDMRGFAFVRGKPLQEKKNGGETMKNKFRVGRMLKLGVTSPYLHKYVVSETLIMLLMLVRIGVQNSYPSVGDSSKP